MASGGVGYALGRADDDTDVSPAEQTSELIEALLAGDLEYLEEGDLGQSGADFCDEFLEQTGGVCVDGGDRVYFADGG